VPQLENNNNRAVDQRALLAHRRDRARETEKRVARPPSRFALASARGRATRTRVLRSSAALNAMPRNMATQRPERETALVRSRRRTRGGLRAISICRSDPRPEGKESSRVTRSRFRRTCGIEDHARRLSELQFSPSFLRRMEERMRERKREKYFERVFIVPSLLPIPSYF